MNDKFTTASLNVAAALLASGCRIEVVRRLDGRRCEFHATPEAKARRLAGEYAMDQLLLSPQRLFECFDDLRTEVRRGGAV